MGTYYASFQLSLVKNGVRCWGLWRVFIACRIQCMSMSSQSLYFRSRLTKCRVREHLIHKFVIPPVAREGKRPSRDMLQFVRRVFLVKSLRGRRWLPLQATGK
jgi:hypothetical protein